MRHELAVMGGNGDTKVVWETEEASAISEAERIFRENVEGKGASAFVINPANPAENRRVDTFDPTAERTVIVPRMQGG